MPRDEASGSESTSYCIPWFERIRFNDRIDCRDGLFKETYDARYNTASMTFHANRDAVSSPESSTTDCSSFEIFNGSMSMTFSIETNLISGNYNNNDVSR
jgi:hypothetical protein